MAHAHCNVWSKELSVHLVGDTIQIQADGLADAYIGTSVAEAVKLRDDLSRAITEAATAAAKAAQPAGEAA